MSLPRLCPRCGSGNLDDDRFCFDCFVDDALKAREDFLRGRRALPPHKEETPCRPSC